MLTAQRWRMEQVQQVTSSAMWSCHNNTLEIFGAKVKNINIVTRPDNTFYKRPVPPPTWHRLMPKGQWPRIS